ncbi:leucine-rich repeat domain-containing protein, partial [Winogradskyella sp.]|uniref:leucine-rich repeat domain-containing protein n=1 Tax=Winogradskyella sp. TaxID=1883156 RepID=UPI0025D696FB
TNIAFPENGMNIQSFTFTGNPITNVISTNLTPTYLNVSATFDNANTIDLTVPVGTASLYNTNWAGFASVTEASALAVNDTFIVDFITYRVISVAPDAVEILDYNTAGGNVVTIPSTVSYAISTYDITNIKNLSFHQKGLTDVTIPNSVTFIGTSAFLDNNLSSVTIPSSLTSLGDYIFAENQLTNVTIPDNILTLGSGTFQDNQIDTVVFSNNITTIGGCAFCFNQLANVTIPDSVTDIGNGAFFDNQLTNVTIPINVINISAQAFRNNPLVSVTSLAVLPPTIETSSAFPAAIDTFNHNRGNINLILPNSATDEYVTDNGALWTGFKMVYEVTSTTTLEVTDYDAANGTSVSIPATITDASVTYDITEIGISAFFDKGLTSVTIPNSITSIGTSAFNTNNLTSITIPDSVITIGSQAFVTNDLTSLIIGNSVMDIGFGAFVDNDLTDITIPDSVTNIGLIAFAANPLTDVTSLATIPPTITTGTNDTFNITGDRSGIHLHIPAGTMGAYVTDLGALWTGFNPVTEDALSVSDFELANGVKIFSTMDAINITASHNVQLENYTLYSISGAKITTGTENRITTSSFAKGIYILKLDFDKGTVVKKIAIK